MNATSKRRPVVYVVPCGAAKADGARAARDLYVSPNFRLTLDAALAALAAAAADGGHVVILSALHGLVELDEIVEPYDVKMGDADSITVTELAGQPLLMALALADAEIYTLLPSAYEARLDAALRVWGAYTIPVYEAAAGIGEHRGIAARMQRTYAAA